MTCPLLLSCGHAQLLNLSAVFCLQVAALNLVACILICLLQAIGCSKKWVFDFCCSMFFLFFDSVVINGERGELVENYFKRHGLSDDLLRSFVSLPPTTGVCMACEAA